MKACRKQSGRGGWQGMVAVALAATYSLGPMAAAPAAVVSWGSPQPIIAPVIDVATTGSLVYAYNVGTSSVAATTINGVTFQAAAFPANGSTNTTSVGSVTFTESPGQLFSYDSLGSLQNPFSGLSADYQALLNHGGSADQAATLTLQLGGLTSGQEYLIQWWTNDSAYATLGVSLNETSGTAGNTVTLDANTSDAAGGLGQYVIGTFTADATTQAIALDGAGAFLNRQPLINGFQVRAVPEPSAAMLAVAATVLAAGWAGHRARGRRRPPGVV